MHAPILRRPALIVQDLLPPLLGVADRSDDVVGSAQLAKRKLDAGACRLSRLQEDEFVFVRDDHAGRAVGASICEFAGTLVQRRLAGQGARLPRSWR
jgi:hypothetical protein